MKKLYFTCVLLVISLLIASCAGSRWSGLRDTNGKEDRTLQTVTAEDILKLNSFLSVISVTNHKSDGTTSVSIDKFSGVKTLETFGKGRYDITVTLKSDNGNIRLVLCDSEKIIAEFEADGESSTVGFDCTSGKVYLKLAGEEAQVDLQYHCKKK